MCICFQKAKEITLNLSSKFQKAMKIISMYLVIENCRDNRFVLISENRGDNQSGGYQNWSKYKNLIMS